MIWGIGGMEWLLMMSIRFGVGGRGRGWRVYGMEMGTEWLWKGMGVDWREG